MTTDEKIMAVGHMPEVADAVKMLYAAFIDCKLQSFIRHEYEIEGRHFELTFQEVKIKHHK